MIHESCSTPYGIKGTIATVPLGALKVFLSAQRLTASKERSLGGWSDEYSHQNIPCSTPYGIKGTIASLISVSVLPLVGCSTPYGIKGTIAITAFTSNCKYPMCSTPYGIKGTIASYRY